MTQHLASIYCIYFPSIWGTLEGILALINFVWGDGKQGKCAAVRTIEIPGSYTVGKKKRTQID